MVKIVEKKIDCYHCGNPCDEETLYIEEKAFCCNGCKTVFEILEENELCSYYDLNENAGVSLKAKNFSGKYDYLNSNEIENQILDFKNESQAKVTFYIPAVHCSSCVWLLENFNKITPGIISSRLNFIKKELQVSYDPRKNALKDIVELLATLGYPPLINLESADKPHLKNQENHKILLRLGVVGFCFGNIMLLSFPEYFKLDLQNHVDASYQKFFLYLNFILALPVFFYGAFDYLKGAYISLKENIKGTTRVLSVDIPIVMGISALFIRSTYETFVNQSSGYWDSLAGLVFFLLVGKWLQQVTFGYLTFERDYKSYFPLAAKLKNGTFKNISDLVKGDFIEIHHQELIPADCVLHSDWTLIDYSFVTGESNPVKVLKNESVFAGGRLVGAKVELEVTKKASQSYLTGLWNNETFNKEKESKTSNFANIFSRYFTYVAIIIAVITGFYWKQHNPDLVWPAITAVLMVACPCALTLAMPFAMNAAMSILGKNSFYVKNQNVIQLLTEIDTIAFDKTGTLTEGKQGKVIFTDGELSDEEFQMIKAISAQSVHPLNKLIVEHLSAYSSSFKVQTFEEFKGKGLEASLNGHRVRLGSDIFLGYNETERKSGQVLVEIDGKYKGKFVVIAQYREGWAELISKLRQNFKLALISGDNDSERSILEENFVSQNIYFNQKPQDKLDFVAKAQAAGQKVLMIGDGLNDAGALKQAHVGVALSEDVNAFSPACDVILDSKKFNKIDVFIDFSKTAMNVVRAAFALSIVYNFVGVGLAATGNLSPLYAAVFMPLSSMSVVIFAVGCTYLFGKMKKLV